MNTRLLCFIMFLSSSAVLHAQLVDQTWELGNQAVCAFYEPGWRGAGAVAAQLGVRPLRKGSGVVCGSYLDGATSGVLTDRRGLIHCRFAGWFYADKGCFELETTCVDGEPTGVTVCTEEPAA